MKRLIRKIENLFLDKDIINFKLLKEAKALKKEALELSLKSSKYLELAKETEINWKKKWKK